MMKTWSLKTHLQLLSLAGLLILAISFWTGQSFLTRQSHEQLARSTINNQQALWNAMLDARRNTIQDEAKALTCSRDTIKALKAGDKAVLAESALPTFRRLQAGGKIDGMIIADKQGSICQVPCDHIPRSRERLFLARELIDVFLSCEEAV